MSRADDVVAFIEGCCIVPDGPMVNTYVKLEPFQKRFIRDVYDNPVGTRKAYLSLARRNGKTVLTACLLLAHLVGPEARQNGQIVSGAMALKQASVIFDYAAAIVDASPELKPVVRVTPSKKELHGLLMGTRYRSLASESETSQGLSTVLAIVDEIGQVRGPTSKFVDSLVKSQGSHKEPLFIAISTQAANDGDLFSIMIDDAAKSGDRRIVSHVFAADEGAELDDEEAWKSANPALGIFRSLEDVEQQAAEAKRMPTCEQEFRNKTLNQRVSDISPFMSKSVWESCGQPPRPLSECLEIYAGLDLSARTDLTAFVLIGCDSDNVWHVHPHLWTPGKTLLDRAKRDRMPYDVWRDQGYLRTTPGASIDYADVVRDIAEITDGLDVQAVAFDRWRIDVFRKELDAIGLNLPLIEHGQGFKDMSPALDTLESEALNGRIRHGMHPVLTSCAASAVVTRDPAGNRKLDKSKATSRIDGLVALAMAFGISSKSQEQQIPPEVGFYWLN